MITAFLTGVLMGSGVGWRLCQRLYDNKLAESTTKLKETTEALGQAVGIEKALTARLNALNQRK